MRKQNIQTLTAEDEEVLTHAETSDFDLARTGVSYACLVQVLRSRYYSGRRGCWLGPTTLLWLTSGSVSGQAPMDSPSPDADQVLKHSLLHLTLLKRPQILVSIGQRVSTLPLTLPLQRSLETIWSTCRPFEATFRERAAAACKLVEMITNSQCGVTATVCIDPMTQSALGLTLKTFHFDAQTTLFPTAAQHRICDMVRCFASLLLFKSDLYRLRESDITAFCPDPALIETWETACKTLGLNTSYQDLLGTIYAVIFHLSQIKYTEQSSHATIKDGATLECIAELLGLPSTAVRTLLTTATRGTSTQQALTLSQAEKRREQLMAELQGLVLRLTLDRVNGLLAPKYGSGSLCEITLVDAAWSQPVITSNDCCPADLARNILVEELWQVLVQGLEHDALSNEKEGIAIPDFETEIDILDNYSLLKLLKGKGGILDLLSMSLSAKDIASEIGTRYRKHPKLALTKASDTSVVIKQLFGTASYDIGQWKETMDDSIFIDTARTLASSRNRALVEACTLLPTYSLALQWISETQSIATLVSGAVCRPWWLLSVVPTTELAIPFSGVALEKALRMVCITEMTSVFAKLGGKTVSWSCEQICEKFGKLVRPWTSARQGAEDICRSAKLRLSHDYILGRSSLLIHPRCFAKLTQAVLKLHHDAAACVQSFARGWRGCQVVFAIKALPTENSDKQVSPDTILVAMRELAIQEQQENTLLSIGMTEGRARLVLREAEKVDRVALHTASHDLRKNILHLHIKKSIEEQCVVERALVKETMKHVNEERVNSMRRVTDRNGMTLQSSKLEKVIEGRLALERKSAEVRARAETSKQMLLQKKIDDIKHAKELTKIIEAKEQRKKLVKEQLEKEMEKRRYDNWLMEQRDKEERNRRAYLKEAWEEQQRDYITRDRIEATMQKRIEKEFHEYQRRKREQQRMKDDEEAVRHAKVIETMARREAFTKFREEKNALMAKDRQTLQERRRAHAAWQVDNEQRKLREEATKRAEKAEREKKRLDQKKIINAPQVYKVAMSKLSDMAANRSVSTVPEMRMSPMVPLSARLLPVDDFVMAGGKAGTQSPIVREAVWEGLVNTLSPRRPASPSVLSL